MAVNSIFPDVSSNEKLQFFIDSRNDKFAQAWYKNYFTFAAPQMSLNYVSVLGESTIAAAASVVSRDGETPLRSREALGKLYGEIPAIKVMRKLNESHYREYMSMQALNVADSTKAAQAFKLIWDDVHYVTSAVDKRLDMMVAQGLSAGKITLNLDTNPDGVTTEKPIDLFLPVANNKSANKNWSDPGATPLQDIASIVNESAAIGLVHGKILMDAATFQIFMANKEVKDTIGTFFGISAAARAGATAPITRNRVNEYMDVAEFPQIEVVNIKIPIQKDGVNTIVNPWAAGAVVFVPSGQLGEIKNAIAVEEERPVEKVVYAKRENTLISKWAENEPFGEWTKAELNAMPSFDTINQVVILNTNA